MWLRGHSLIANETPFAEYCYKSPCFKNYGQFFTTVFHIHVGKSPTTGHSPCRTREPFKAHSPGLSEICGSSSKHLCAKIHYMSLWERKGSMGHGVYKNNHVSIQVGVNRLSWLAKHLYGYLFCTCTPHHTLGIHNNKCCHNDYICRQTRSPSSSFSEMLQLCTENLSDRLGQIVIIHYLKLLTAGLIT